MSDIITTTEADSPLIISFPHSGMGLAGLDERLTEAGLARADTDHLLPELYETCVDIAYTAVIANLNRYVIDLNRDPDGTSLYPGEDVTELCPTTTFDYQPIYTSGNEFAEAEIAERKACYYRPYHAALQAQIDRVKAKYGYALLWDAHSVPAVVPRFFDGVLSDLNIGDYNGRACAPARIAAIMLRIQESDFSGDLNGRFKGGYITRLYGAQDGVDAVQLELSQSAYLMDDHVDLDTGKINSLKPVLASLLKTFVSV